MTKKITHFDKLEQEIEKVTDLLNQLAIVLSNAQPEAIGKIRLVYCKTSQNDTNLSFIFNIKDHNSSKLKRYQKAVPMENIVKRLQRRDPFKDNYPSAKKALQMIVSLIQYRNDLLTKRTEIMRSITNLLRPNHSRLALNLTSAKQIDDAIYENLKSRGLEDYYNHTDL